jgi:glycosyltransferase involved in cell wall biosynthesis
MPRPTLWIDISDLFNHFAAAKHPTGISRMVVALADTLARAPGAHFGAVHPIFWHPVQGRALRFAGEMNSLKTFFGQLQSRYAAAGMAPRPFRSRLTKGLVTAIPKPLRYVLFPSLYGTTQFVQWAKQADMALAPVQFASGDCLFVPGSFWLGAYAPTMARQARSAGASVVAFVHDVLLLSNPEWMGGRHGEQFRRGADSFLPLCAAIACNSEHTRETLRAHVSLPDDQPIAVCRLADTFEIDASPASAPEVDRFEGEAYALFVSTIIPRKNHTLLVKAWIALAARRGTNLPTLVFVGGGNPDAPLASALALAQSRGVPIERVTGIDDASLERLYRGAWLTLYPSLGEGYGLPVAEALARGKVCLAAPSGGIAEIAPGLIDAIDPHDPEALADKLARYLDEPGRLAAREAEIRAAYRPTAWSNTAEAVRAVLERSVRQ